MRRRKARPHSNPAVDQSAGACPDCGKQRYVTRKDARWAARRRTGDTNVNAYRCGDYWHYGHHRDDVRRGLTGREAYNERTDT